MTPWTIARQAALSMGFSRQEYRSESPCPPPGDLPDPGIKSTSLKSPAFSCRFFTDEQPGQGKLYNTGSNVTYKESLTISQSVFSESFVNEEEC